MPTGHANRLMPTLRRVVLAKQSAARSDGELLGAFVAERDGDAFAELVRRHGPMVLGVCRRVTGDRAAADDAFQGSFLVLARRAAAVRPREQVGNFLYGVAYRTALKARMVLARRRSREKQVDAMPEPTAPAARADWTDLQPVIDEELARLPDKLRLPVVLCDLEGRPQREVARHLDVPVATLATRLASARRTLAARLTRRGVALSGGALAGLLGAHASASAVPPALAGGVARAGEAVAGGASLDSLVSANAVQLSEGVMRMMMLAKLKAVAVLAVTALTLTTGLGLGLVPAAAEDAPAPRSAERATTGHARAATAPRVAVAPRPKERTVADARADDATFLHKLCLDVRGTPPTDVETWFFVSDVDDDKRAKVVHWVTDDEPAKVIIAKKLGVPAERVKLVRGRQSADGKFVDVHYEIQNLSGDRHGAPKVLAYSATGDTLAISGKPLQGPNTAAATWVPQRKVLVAGALDNGASAGWGQFFLADAQPGASDTEPRFQTITFVDTERVAVWLNDENAGTGSDAEFLKRVLADVRGSGPTALELKYFTEDKDPKKREKLIDALLKEPAVQKKLGDAWKAKMLALKPMAFKAVGSNGGMIWSTVGDKVQDVVIPRFITKPVPPQPPVPPRPPVAKPIPVPLSPPAAPAVDKFGKLVGELIAAKKPDAAILEALTLATLGRLPTDGEKKLTLAGLSNAADRKAAWLAVARALAGADEKPTAKIKFVVEPIQATPPLPPKPPAPPVPPARP